MKSLLLSTLLGLSACARLSGYTDAGADDVVVKRQYPDGAEGLRTLYADVLEAARRDEREKVHALLATLIMTDTELTTLFGDDATLRTRYHSMMETLIHRGAVELVGQVYERKLDDVSVVEVDLSAKTATPEERAVAAALKQPVTMYSVRIKKKSDDRGLRYDLFFYFGGHWRTGNQLGKFLLPPPKPPEPPKSAPAGKVATKPDGGTR